MQTPSSTPPPISDRLFGWWYALAAPSAASDTIFVRRGKLISLVLLIEMMSILPWSFASSSPFWLLPLTISMVILVIGVFLNRRGKTLAAGILVVATLEMSLSFSIVSVGVLGPGLSPITLPGFILLLQPALLAVSLFPPQVSFVIGAYNCAFVAAALFFLPKTAEMASDLSTSGFAIYYVPISTQMLVLLVSTLWATSALREMKRAAHAEKMNKLAQDILSNPTILRQVLLRSQSAEHQRSSDLDDWSSESWY